jgi:hypothetical protein
MTRDRTTLATIAVVAVVFVLTMGAPTVMADTLTLTIGVPNSDVSAYPGPYANVTVNRTDNTHATITFNTLDQGKYDYFIIDSSIADVNVNATSWTIGGFSFTAPSFSSGKASNLSSGGSGNVDGFGTFNQTLNNKDGYAQAATEVDFTLTNTSGTWASAASVLTPNGSGWEAAAHVAVCDTSTNPTCNTTPGAVATGYAANGSVPDGGLTVMLLGGALVCVETLRRRFRA